MRLKDFIDLDFPIQHNEYIFLNNFESFFSDLGITHPGFRNIIVRERKETRKILEDSFKINDGTGKLSFLLSCPDTDIPCIKNEYFLIDNLPYSNEYQSRMEGMEIVDFLEIDMLESIPDNIQIFCHSVIKKHPRLHMIPIGRDFKGASVLRNFHPRKKERDILCYYNCSLPNDKLHWYGRIREHIFNGVSGREFILCEKVDTYLGRNGFNIFSETSFLQYYDKLLRSKFIIAPRGCALDTYRLWDAIYLGCIPIVVKYEGYQQFEDLPILFLDKWEDYLKLDKQFLENKWVEMMETEWNYDKIKFSYWKELILNSNNFL